MSEKLEQVMYRITVDDDAKYYNSILYESDGTLIGKGLITEPEVSLEDGCLSGLERASNNYGTDWSSIERIKVSG